MVGNQVNPTNVAHMIAQINSCLLMLLGHREKNDHQSRFATKLQPKELCDGMPTTIDHTMPMLQMWPQQYFHVHHQRSTANRFPNEGPLPGPLPVAALWSSVARRSPCLAASHFEWATRRNGNQRNQPFDLEISIVDG